MNTAPTAIAPGVVVILDYILLNSEGELLDETHEGDPMVYLHGHENVAPGLEDALLGHSAGDAIEAEVGDVFGAVSEEVDQDLPRDAFPLDMELEAGMELGLETDGGEEMPIWILDSNDESVRVSFNHPLAGQALTFNVKILELRKPSSEELEHGHPHGRTGQETH